MDFLCVGKTKLKVVLNERECREYGVSAIDGAPGGKEARTAIRKILDLAAEKCGFRLSNERVLIQRYPTADGGAELFITRLSSVAERERQAISNSPELVTFGSRCSVYRFSSLSHLIRAARAVRESTTPCDVFHSDDGDYYIRIDEDPVSGISQCEALSEFGTRVSALPVGISGERGRLVIKEKGIEILSRL